jgi:hypothetical protein
MDDYQWDGELMIFFWVWKDCQPRKHMLFKQLFFIMKKNDKIFKDSILASLWCSGLISISCGLLVCV